MPNNRNRETQEWKVEESVNSYICNKHNIRVSRGDQCPFCLREQEEKEKSK